MKAMQDNGTTKHRDNDARASESQQSLRAPMATESFWQDFRKLFRSGPHKRRDDDSACFTAPRVTPCALMLSALTIFTSAASAQSWQTVDDFQYVLGQDAENTGLAVAPTGTLFACGWGNDGNSSSHALIMASADGGTTWSSPLDDFINGGGYWAYYNGITSDYSGNIYGVGYYYLDSGAAPNYWFVRRSMDGGATWSTTDFYHDSTNNSYMTQPYAVSADAAGNVYVAGYSDSYGWVVRKGIGGTNFTTVDVVSTTVVTGGAYAIYAHPTAGIFAAGVGPIGTSKGKTSYGWVTRRSTNGGATWSSVDAFSLSSGARFSAGYGIGADALGNLYVVGRADAVSGSGRTQTVVSHWIVRKSSNGGTSWSTVDDFLGGQAKAFAADSNGKLFVAGDGIVRENPGGTGTWQTVDNFVNAASAAADASGHVFVGGSGNTGGVDHWLVRRH